MQLKFVSLGLLAAVLMTAVNADTVGVKGTDVRVSHVLEDIANNANVDNVANNLKVKVARRKRSLSASKKVATAIRRRAIARRSEEADEEEADEEEEEDQDTTAQEDSEESTEESEEDVEAAATEEDEAAVADDEEETAEEDSEESAEDSEEDESQWERRDLPVLGSLLGGDKSTTGGSTGGLLGAL